MITHDHKQQVKPLLVDGVGEVQLENSSGCDELHASATSRVTSGQVDNIEIMPSPGPPNIVSKYTAILSSSDNQIFIVDPVSK